MNTKSGTFFLIVSSLLINACFITCCKKPQVSGPVVWAGGPVQITDQELQESFLLKPQFPANLKGRTALQAHLDGMVRYKYLAWSGEQHGLDRDERVYSRLQWVRHKAMREQLFKHEISRLVTISEKELRAAFIKRNRFLSVRHLFVGTREEGQQWRDRLLSGLSFDLAARAVYAEVDEDMAAAGGKLAPFTWGDMDPDFEAAAFLLRPGELSQPVASPWGYHIIRLDSITINPMVTENDFVNDRKKIERILRQRKEDSLATRYVTEVMQGLDVHVKGSAFSYIVNQARQAVQPRTGFLPPHVALSDREWETVAASLRDRQDQVFMTYRDGQWTLGEFIRRFQSIPPLYRPHLQQPELFEKELRNMIRDEFLNDRAEKLGLNDHPYVEQKVYEAKQDLMSAAMAQKLAGGLVVAEAEVQRYYKSHLATFGTDPHESTWQEIRKRALKSKQDSVVSAFVWNWQRSTQPRKDEKLLEDILQRLGGDQAAFIAVWQPPQQ